MRLRSSKFVFLLLLVCSVQTREEFALHLIGSSVAKRAGTEAQHREAGSADLRRSLPASPPVDASTPETRLDAASRAAHRTPWSMRRPALASAAISSFTGFLRA